MSDKKTFRDLTSTNNTGTNSSSTNGITMAADRAKDILTYQTLLQNEMFGTHIDYLCDEQHVNNVHSNGNSNNSHSTGNVNQSATIETGNHAGTTIIGHAPTGQIHSTANSAINVNEHNSFLLFSFLYTHTQKKKNKPDDMIILECTFIIICHFIFII